MIVRSLKILCRFTFPNGQIIRLWEGSGPYLDAEGDIWHCCALVDGAIDVIEAAINGEAWEMQLALSRVDKTISNLAWEDYQSGNVIDAKMELLLQDCDDEDQPLGDPRVIFIGRIDDLEFDEISQGDAIFSTITVLVRNRFVLRKQLNGAVLSDNEQQLRSALLNPGAEPDRFCQRVPRYVNKTIRWPAWN